MKGTINVKTENIFPVIKKFLYSDQEIFLREIVSNAVDATQKLKTLTSLGKNEGELGDLTIQVEIDTKKKILKVIDRGIGMTEDEVDKYINQIAFSGAEEFLDKFKGKSEAEANALIGHFGLGFYSAFMVSDVVEIFTKSYNGAPAVHWHCDGGTEYSIETCDKEDRGTEIWMHLNDDAKEFCEDSRIHGLLTKYCKFMPVAIRFGDEMYWEDSEKEKDKDGKPKREEKKRPRIINNTSPLWKQRPADLTEEDYMKFYHELYPMNFQDTMFYIHLNVDYPFTLNGILYFPKIQKQVDANRDKIQLYCNQVFVTDSVEGIVPDYLLLLHGVLDSPDIPLNVSRSYLQSDANVKKISGHISKKVADKLEELFTKERESFEKKFEDLKVFLEYGMITDEKFFDKARKFYLFKNTDGKTFTMDDYCEHIKALQTDKDKKLIYLYATDSERQYSYIEQAKAHGYDVLNLDSVLSSHFINFMEQKLENSNFVRVDADVVDKLIQKGEDIPFKLTEEQQNKLKEMVGKGVDGKIYTVQLESLSSTDRPMQITQNEFMRRVKEMSAMGGGGMYSFYGDMPDQYNLVVNTNHPVIEQLLNETNEETQKTTLKQLTDLALLSKGLLKGEQLNDFISRSVDILK